MLSMTKVDQAPLCIALLEDNELAKLPQLSLSDRSHENWIIFGRCVRPVGLLPYFGRPPGSYCRCGVFQVKS
jgi:hypothetical protein